MITSITCWIDLPHCCCAFAQKKHLTKGTSSPQRRFADLFVSAHEQVIRGAVIIMTSDKVGGSSLAYGSSAMGEGQYSFVKGAPLWNESLNCSLFYAQFAAAAAAAVQLRTFIS